jgi:hypothetical protein
MAEVNETKVTETKVCSPIKSGWRGDLNGYIEHTDSASIEVSEVTLRLDKVTAWALCNVLTDHAIKEMEPYTDESQRTILSTLGAALGRMIDHHSANNGGRKCVK